MPGAWGLKSVGANGGVQLILIPNGNVAAIYSGPKMLSDARGYTKWWFQLASAVAVLSAITNVSVSIYGTADPAAALPQSANQQYAPNPAYPAPGVAGGNWILLVAQSEASGSTFANPMTPTAPALVYNQGPLFAVCAVQAAGVAVTGGPVQVLCYASE